MLRVTGLFRKLHVRRRQPLSFSHRQYLVIDSKTMATETSSKREIVIDASADADAVSAKRAKLDEDVSPHGGGSDIAAMKLDENSATESAEAPELVMAEVNTENGQKSKSKGKGKDKVWEGRKRRGTRREGEDGIAGTEDKDKAPRLPKRQSALLIGFCGSGFNGMQMCVLQIRIPCVLHG